MKIIVALGNPGKTFEKTRHNIGFLAIDNFCKDQKITNFQNKKNVQFYKGKDFILVKPLSFMNNSGQPLLELAKYFKVETQNILVIYDDINLDIGRLRIKPKGSCGGHNGMKNIIKILNEEKIKRIRIGVGKNIDINLSKWVLSDFTKEELKNLEKVFIKVNDIISLFIDNNFSQAMNKYN